MLQHIFDVRFRSLNVLLHVEVGTCVLRMPGLFLHYESDRVHCIHF
jgi:hypothetical protein